MARSRPVLLVVFDTAMPAPLFATGVLEKNFSLFGSNPTRLFGSTPRRSLKYASRLSRTHSSMCFLLIGRPFAQGAAG